MRTARLLPVSPSMHCSPGDWPKGVYLPRGVYLAKGGVPAQGRVYLPRGVPAQGVYLPMWGTCPGNPPPTVDRMTDTCKNITLANFVCGR